jgi:phage terminase small subunit
MTRGGYRPGAGRPKGARTRSRLPDDILRDAANAGMSPLEYMLAEMRDPKADQARRDRMAIVAAPFCHARADAEPEGKKAQRRMSMLAMRCKGENEMEKAL